MDVDPRAERVLQRIPLRPDVLGMPDTLWLRGVTDQRQDPLEPLRLAAEHTCSFDTYFGSCYVGYWSRIADLGGVSAEFVVEGSATIRLWLTADGSSELVDERSVSASEPTEISLGPYRLPPDHTAEGRLWCEVIPSADTSIVSGRWTAEHAPVREVSLGVVVCTINRQEYLRRNLERLIETGGAFGSIQRLVIVNQGDPLEMPETLGSLGEHLSVEVITQPNLGGSGGFARGMFELTADDDISHVVLLDDDVVLNPDSLDRLRRLMRYAGSEVCIGGHMFDLSRPSMLYETGSTLKADGTGTVPINHDVDVSLVDGLDPVGRFQNADYNGWWFFGLATRVIGDVGLPMPCFIRGDDIEYGVRLVESGYRTVAMPGIALWHEPFYAKLANWQHYFDIRNRLTMVAIHGNGSVRALKRNLRKQFHRDAMLSRYHSCEYLLMAVSDHLAGPQRCLDTTDAALTRCKRVFDELGPRRVDDPVGEPNGDRSHPVGVAVRRIARLVWPVRDAIGVDVAAGSLSPMLSGVFDRYRVIEFDGSVWEFTRDPGHERRQLVSLERLLFRWRRPAFDASVVDEADGAPWVRWWSDLFGRI